MTPPLAYLMYERCRCGELFLPRNGNQRNCSDACRIRQGNERTRLRRAAQKAMRAALAAPRGRPRRPKLCGCGGRFALAADLQPSTRCMSCDPFTTRGEQIVENRRVRAATHDRGMLSPFGPAGQHVRERMRQERAA